MQMRYLLDDRGNVHGFDVDDTRQVDLMNRIGGTWEDVTDSWPRSPAPEEFQALIGAKVDELMDDLARSWRYRDSTRLLAARGSTNPQYDAEGQAFESYWSECWTLLDELESRVLSGQSEMPATVADVIAMLPKAPERPQL